MKTLYRKNSIGISEWSIWNEGATIIIAHSTVIGGSKVSHSEVVKEGKQSRTLEQQVQHRIASRISKQRDKGYTDSIEAASTQLLNQLGLVVPMLAKTHSEKLAGNPPYFIQRKLDGLRCLATKQDGEIILYSRRGKIFDNLPEITAELHNIIPEGETFDGELYCHGVSLQTTGSWIKKRQADTPRIKYYIYDCVEDRPFEDRIDFVKDCFNKKDYDFVNILPTKKVHSKIEVDDAMMRARSSGFEGLMIRLNNSPYENGKRSSSLLKLKEVMSDEAVCTNIFLSDKGNPVLELEWRGVKFNATPPGSHADRIKALDEKSINIGKPVTFEYRGITDDGLPFHAVATNWRYD